MRSFLINHGDLVTFGIVLAEMLLVLILLYDAIRKKKLPVSLMLLIGLGLMLDAGIIAAGYMIPNDLIGIFGKVRFVAHGLLLPLNLAICGYALKWDYTIILKIVWALTLLACCGGAFAGFSRTLELRDFAGVLRHAAADNSPEWAETVNRILSFGTVLPIIAAGAVVLFRDKNPWFFLAGASMFGFALAGPISGNTDLIFLISMFGELLMLFFFMIYEKTAWKVESGLY